MTKYVILGGFLGAGKTTSMIAFSEYLNLSGKKPAILVDDLGSRNLVDSKFTELSGCVSQEITGGCICYQTENLVDKLRRFRDRDKADIIFSDIPGCGIGALDHVYHKLNDEYPNEFEFCPFVAIADPERLRMIMPEKADINLPTEMEYLFHAQLLEAEVIVLNKIDLLSSEQRMKYRSFLEKKYPQAKVFEISAKDRIGIADVVDYLMNNNSSLPVVDIGYGGSDFIAAEQKLSWYNRQFSIISASGKTFDGNAFSEHIINTIKDILRKNERNVPHLKIFGTSENGESVKASLIGVDYDMIFDTKLRKQVSNLSVIINARAACESELLDNIMNDALDKIVNEFGLKKHIFFTECFGMMDDGRM